MMSKAKWFAVRKLSTVDDCHISQSDCPAEIPWTYKNVVLYSPDLLSSCSVEGGSGDKTIYNHVQVCTVKK